MSEVSLNTQPLLPPEATPPPTVRTNERRPKRKKARDQMQFEKLLKHLNKHLARFLLDENERPFVVLDQKRISLDITDNNYALKKLMLDACNETLVGASAKAAIQRLQVHAANSAARLALRQFSALSIDRRKLFLPIHGGKVLVVSGEGTGEIDNGDSSHGFWLEHSNESPFNHSPGDTKQGLADFERLLVESQACKSEEMKWFVAMNEGLFPFVREACTARLIAIHQGPSQQGKTSGAKRFTLLHGLGDVKGDYSPAALATMPDCGLLVLDNKEHSNLTQPLIDFLLYAATGAERGRATQDGQMRVNKGSRPVVVVTSIEGVFKAELQNRCVEIPYAIKGQPRGRMEIESEILNRRSQILSALVPVLQAFLRRPSQAAPNPFPNFEEHFRALCDLLRAYGEVATKPEGWADRIIESWDKSLANDRETSDELEAPLREIIRKFEDTSIGSEFQFERVEIQLEGRMGTLYISDSTRLLSMLQKELGYGAPRQGLPRTASGLTSRLKSCKFDVLVFLATDTQDVPELKRTAARRPIGLWLPKDDALTGDDAFDNLNVMPEHPRNEEVA